MRTIPLTRGKIAIVDNKDYAFLAQRSWCCGADGYVKSEESLGSKDGKRKRRTLLMHREIIRPKIGYEVDHINKDKLDNRRRNLRIATRSQNCMNRESFSGASSRYKGVSWHRTSQKWAARIKKDGKTKWLGTFKSERAAARAFDDHVSKMHGKFAVRNFAKGKNK